MDVFNEVNDILYGNSHTQKASIFRTMYDHCKPLHHTTNEADSVTSTSSKKIVQHHGKFHRLSRKPDFLPTSLNPPASTVNTLMSRFPSHNPGPSTSAINPAQGIYDHIPDLIFGIINSKMKISDPGINGLYAQAEKIRIISNIATKCNILATKQKGKMKRKVDNLKPKHSDETQEQFVREFHSIMDGLPSGIVDNSSRNTDIIPKRIKGMISEKLSSEKNTLSISNFEVFFNKTKNKRNIRYVAKSLNIPISRLKKQLKEIKMRFDRGPELGNREENQFMKRVERIIKSLNQQTFSSTSSPTQSILEIITKRNKELISQMKSLFLDIGEFNASFKKASNRKYFDTIENGVGDLKKQMNRIKIGYDKNLENEKKKERLRNSNG